MMFLLLAINHGLQYYASPWELFKSRHPQNMSLYYYTFKSNLEWSLLSFVIKTLGHLHLESPSQPRWVVILKLDGHKRSMILKIFILDLKHGGNMKSDIEHSCHLEWKIQWAKPRKKYAKQLGWENEKWKHSLTKLHSIRQCMRWWLENPYVGGREELTILACQKMPQEENEFV